MTNYKINEQRILEILRKYDKDFIIVNNAITLRYYNRALTLVPKVIERVANNDIDNECTFFENMIIEKLHPYANECFEEVKKKYSYEKCKKFLEDNGFVVHENAVERKCINNQNETILVTLCFNEVLNRLNGDDTIDLFNDERIIATILNANKDKLMEE